MTLRDILKSLNAVKLTPEEMAEEDINRRRGGGKGKKSNDTSVNTDFDYNELCDNVTETTAFREDPFICNRYVRCNHGYAQKFKCSLNTAWDIARRLCIWTDGVDCGSRLYVADEELLGENDPDELVRHNVTRRPSSSTKSTTPTSTTSALKSTR